MNWGAVAGSVLGNVGSALGIGILDKNLGSKSRPEYSQEEVLQQIQMGNALDLQNQKDMFDYRISYGKALGMTNYEMMMGPAAGAGGGTTGSGQTLGNSASAVNQAKMQADTATRENRANRAAGIIQTAMQTDAQKYAADRAAGVQERGQDIQAMIAGNRLALDERQLNEVAIPQLANATKLNEQQVKIAINEVANTDPKWIRKKTVMQLGVDNGIQNLVLGRLHLDLTDPEQIYSLTDDEYADALEALLAASSGLGKTSAAVESIMERIFGKVKEEGERARADRAMERGREMLGRPDPHDYSETERVLGNSGPVPAGTEKYKNFSRDFPGRY